MLAICQPFAKQKKSSTPLHSFQSAFCAIKVGKFASRKAFVKEPSSGIKRASGAARPSVITCASACQVFHVSRFFPMENDHLSAISLISRFTISGPPGPHWRSRSRPHPAAAASRCSALQPGLGRLDPSSPPPARPNGIGLTDAIRKTSQAQRHSLLFE